MNQTLCSKALAAKGDGSALWFESAWIKRFLDLRNEDAEYIAAASPDAILQLLYQLDGALKDRVALAARVEVLEGECKKQGMK